MKKIFTILMSAFIALSANAALVKRDAPVQVKDMKKEMKVPAYEAKAEGQTINITANNLSVDLSYLDLYYEYFGYGYVGIEGGDGVYDVEASLYPDSLVYYGSYSTEDSNIELSVYDAEGAEIEIDVTNARFAQTAKGDMFTAIGVDEDGNTYNITLTLFAPDQSKDTVKIAFGEALKAKYYPDTEDYYIYAENANYAVTLDIYTDELAGKYAKNDFDLYYTGLYKIANGDTTSVGEAFDVKAEIVLVDGVYQIAADLFMTDSIYYQITTSYKKPVATDTVRYAFAEPVMIDKYDEDYYFYAHDDKYALAVDYYSNTVAGEFDLKNGDFYTYYTHLSTVNGTDTVSVGYEDINLVIKENVTGYDITVNYFGSNNIYYIFSLTSNKAKADSVAQINLTDAKYQALGTWGSYYGMYHYVMAAPADSAYVFSLGLKPEVFVGSFTSADLNAQYSGISAGKAYYQFVDGEFSVAEGNKGSYTLSGWLLAKNNVKYEFVIKTAEDKTEGVEDVQSGKKATKRIVDGNIIIEKDGHQFNILGSNIK